MRADADLNDVHLHDLRHSFASTLINAGVSIYEVQKLLGHTNIATTQRYAHLASEVCMKLSSCWMLGMGGNDTHQPNSDAEWFNPNAENVQRGT